MEESNGVYMCSFLMIIIEKNNRGKKIDPSDQMRILCGTQIWQKWFYFGFIF